MFWVWFYDLCDQIRTTSGKIHMNENTDHLFFSKLFPKFDRRTKTYKEAIMFPSIAVVNTKTFNKNAYPNALVEFIGRPSILKNKSILGKDGNREEVIEQFRYYLNLERLKDDSKVWDRVMELAIINMLGIPLVLVCFCKPLACHGDVIKAAIRWLQQEELKKVDEILYNLTELNNLTEDNKDEIFNAMQNGDDEDKHDARCGLDYYQSAFEIFNKVKHDDDRINEQVTRYKHIMLDFIVTFGIKEGDYKKTILRDAETKGELKNMGITPFNGHWKKSDWEDITSIIQYIKNKKKEK